MDGEGINEETASDGKRSRSQVWQYFEVENRNEWLARCKECQKTLSYRSSISNLKKHLVRKHGDMIVKVSDDEGEAETVEEITYLDDEEDVLTEQDSEIYDKRKILRNGAWEYFKVLDEENKLATCTICREQFSYRTTSTNLAKHLKRRHCIEFEKVIDEDFAIQREDHEVEEEEDDDDDNDEEDSDDKNKSGDKRRAKTSAAWEFFTIKDHDRRLATCKLCDSEFSYLTSVSNLMKHVRKRHGVKTKLVDESQHFDDDVDSKQDLRNQNRSSVWLYFKCIDPIGKVSVCLICKKQLSHLTSITNLKKHLYRKHPGVQLHGATNGKKMLISSDGQLYEIEEGAAKQEQPDDDEHDQSSPLELNAIYLDDYESAPARKRARTRSPPYARRARTRSPPYARRARPVAFEPDASGDALSSDEEVTFQKKYVRKKHDSLDQFGKYLVSLLKQLPKELSNQLQAECVQQVLRAQLRHEAQAAPPDPAGDS